MGVFSRTWALMGASWRVLMLDKELLLFPLLSLIATALVTVTFFVPLAQTQLWPFPDETASQADDVRYAITLFLFYVCSYFTVVFFNASLIAAVHLRLTGKDPTLMDGMRGAWARKGELFAWTLLAATVGLILSSMKDKAKGWTSLFVSAAGLAWNLATFFVVPILVIEGKGPMEAIQESAATLKRTWGEELVGGISYGGISSLLALPAIAIVLFGVGDILHDALLHGLLLIGVALVYVFLLSLTITTLSAIFNVAVYHYARTGSVPLGFDATLLQSAFVKK